MKSGHQLCERFLTYLLDRTASWFAAASDFERDLETAALVAAGLPSHLKVGEAVAAERLLTLFLEHQERVGQSRLGFL